MVYHTRVGRGTMYVCVPAKLLVIAFLKTDCDVAEEAGV